jgi:hypothetical protein
LPALRNLCPDRLQEAESASTTDAYTSYRLQGDSAMQITGTADPTTVIV